MSKAAFGLTAAIRSNAAEGQGQGKSESDESGAKEERCIASTSPWRTSRSSSWGPGAVAQGRDCSAESARSLGVEELTVGTRVVCPEASYFGAACQVAGRTRGVDVQDTGIHYTLQLTGTTSESLLRHHSGHPDMERRVRRCEEACTGDRTSEDLIHVKKIRKLVREEGEEGWTRNLEKVEPAEDELAALRARGEDLDRPAVPGRSDKGEKREKEKKKEKSHSRGKRSKKSKKDKMKKKHRSRSPSRAAEKGRTSKEEKVKKATSTSSSSSRSVQLNGKRPRGAATNTPEALFSGTGLDPCERVRRRVMRLAKKAVKKKSKDKSSSNSRSSSTDDSPSGLEEMETALFEGENRVQRVADLCPGALSAQALASMKGSLLQEIGAENTKGELKPIALMYHRQQLARKASGPVLRELLTLALSIDHLLRGRPARACDTLLQRMKAIESVLLGAHWSVAQRLEVAPTDSLAMAGREEMVTAQRAAYEESKTRQLAALPDGRPKGKNSSKGKEDSKPKGKGKSSGKDKGRQKEETASK